MGRAFRRGPREAGKDATRYPAGRPGTITGRGETAETRGSGIQRRLVTNLVVMVAAITLVPGARGRSFDVLAAPVRSEAGVAPEDLFADDSTPEVRPAGHVRSESRARGRFIRPHLGAVTSFFGPRDGGEHTGIDIDASTGDRVGAAAGGIVVHAGPYFGYGQTIIVDHGRGYSTLYGHLSRMDVGLDGAVDKGTVIGRVGCTGDCSGDHLHFEIRIDGDPVDPLPFLPGGGKGPRPAPLVPPTTMLAFGPAV
jgi:murein DD-endopeptidase MepM/ murein hydrolase activator NlpD